MSDMTLDSFLVRLGFSIDGSSERRFAEAVKGARLAVVGATAAMTGLVVAVAKVAESYETLFYQSQRVQSTVGNIQALRYAMSQLGGSAAGANAALEGIAGFLRSSPNAEGFFTRLGVATRSMNGGMRDSADILHDFVQQLKGMPFYRAQAYAGVAGIDPGTLMVLMRDTGKFEAQLKSMYAAVGIDGNKAAAASAKFMQQLRAIGATAQVLRDKVALSLEKGVGGSLDVMRNGIVANLSRAGDAIAGFIESGMQLGYAIAQFAGQGIAWFEGLDGGTRKWIEGIGLLGAAWILLNRGFMASPIGRVMELVGAIGLLVQDYEVWKHHGKSLIDWAAWKPGIDAASDAIRTFEKLIADVWPKIRPYLMPLVGFMGHEFLDAFRTSASVLTHLFQALDDAMNGRWNTARKDLGAAWSDIQASGQEAQIAAGAVMVQEQQAAGTPYPFNAARGIRNNNPLNLAYLPGQGAIDSDGRFGRYASMADGVAAAERQLLLYRKRGLDTVSKIISKWAPSSDGNDTKGYIAQVAAAIGIDPNAHLDVGDPATAERLIGAMGVRESGLRGRGGDIHHGVLQGLGMDFGANSVRSMALDYGSRYGGAPDPALKGLGGSQITVAPKVDIHVNGAGDPKAVGSVVRQQQDMAVANLVRNMGPLVR